jgi:hypothetical protein
MKLCKAIISFYFYREKCFENVSCKYLTRHSRLLQSVTVTICSGSRRIPVTLPLILQQLSSGLIKVAQVFQKQKNSISVQVDSLL